MNGNSKEASVQAILEGVDYLQIQFSAKMDEQTAQVEEVYNSLKMDVLSSAQIDMITSDISNRIRKLKDEFQELANNIRKDLGVSADTISQATKNIENTLGNQ